MTRLTDSLHEDQNVYVCDHVLLYSFYKEKCYRQNLQRNSKDILCSLTFFPPKYRVVFETAWENVVEPGRLQMTI